MIHSGSLNNCLGRRGGGEEKRVENRRTTVNEYHNYSYEYAIQNGTWLEAKNNTVTGFLPQ